MSDVIRFLETLGGQSRVAAGSIDLSKMITSLDVDVTQRKALLDGDHAALSDLLGGRRILRCSIFSPDEEEQPLQPDGDVPADEPVQAE